MRSTPHSASPMSATGRRASSRFCRRDADLAPSLLVEAGQQAECALEHIGRDQAWVQASFDLHADQHGLPDRPRLGWSDTRSQLVAFDIGVGEVSEAALASAAV